MKHLRIPIAIIIFIILVCSCEEGEKEIEKNQFSTALTEIELKPSTDWVVVLPGLGCKGCIQEGEIFMKENINNDHIKFILTKIESLKILQKKIGVNLDDYHNIYLDKDNSFEVTTNNTIYPCIIKMEDNQYIDHEFQSPENSLAFDKLKAQIQ
ncbi:hypothetical protein JM658_16065 [Joostella atrarenae]|uniref:Copper chaperone NosL n=1 Tax=Joostella atrarenae TaxID=679257 RepID=A0ABS9J7E3_9FLAO|nr:hypothetical protein [Joostella atrarenae]MCF8716346.1 hypothetical protein [Joostella atrarenae]